MPRTWIFVDEQGDPKYGARNSTYFGLAAIVTRDPVAIGTRLDRLRHDLWSHEHVQRGYFHAQEDCFDVREAVFRSFAGMPIAQAVVSSVTKSGIYEDIRSPRIIYQVVLRFLLGHILPAIPHNHDVSIIVSRWPFVPDLAALVTEAVSVSTTRRPPLVTQPYIVMQAANGVHAGLQLADYLGWATHRLRVRNESVWLQMLASGGFKVRDTLEF